MRRNEVTVGLVLAAGMLLVIFGTLWLKSARLGAEQRTIEARFREAGQLMEGNAVKVRGVPIAQSGVDREPVAEQPAKAQPAPVRPTVREPALKPSDPIGAALAMYDRR